MRISVIFLFLVLPLLSAAAPAHFNHGHSTRPKRPNDTILRSYSRAHILRQRYPAAVSKPVMLTSVRKKKRELYGNGTRGWKKTGRVLRPTQTFSIGRIILSDSWKQTGLVYEITRHNLIYSPLPGMVFGFPWIRFSLRAPVVFDDRLIAFIFYKELIGNEKTAVCRQYSSTVHASCNHLK